jgi:DNA-binding protein
VAKDDMMFAGYISLTGKSPEEIQKMNIYSMDIYNQYEKDKDEKLKKRTEEINKAYDEFFKKIENEDLKIETIRSATKEITEERKNTYKEILQMFGASILSLGAKGL